MELAANIVILLIVIGISLFSLVRKDTTKIQAATLDGFFVGAFLLLTQKYVSDGLWIFAVVAFAFALWAMVSSYRAAFVEGGSDVP